MKRPEEAIQRAIVQLLSVYEAQGHLTYFAVENGGLRTKAEAGVGKAMGRRAGVPDLCILWDGGCGFIEVKAPKGVFSQAQKEWRAKIQDAGHWWAECRDVAGLPRILTGWGAISGEMQGVAP